MLKSKALYSLLFLPLGGCDAFAIDRCMDNGGVWLKERKACFCSYNRTGKYEAEPSEEQLAHRQFCEGLGSAQSIRDALAEIEQ